MNLEGKAFDIQLVVDALNAKDFPEKAKVRLTATERELCEKYLDPDKVAIDLALPDEFLVEWRIFRLHGAYEVANLSSKIPIATRGARIATVFSRLLPKWFLDEFGISLLDDLLEVAKEQGSSLWWLTITTQLLGIAFKFVWRRVDRRKRRSSSGVSNNDR